MEGADPASHSVTALMVYEACPHQYYVNFVLGIPPPRTPAMETGVNIHKLIADHLTQPSLFPPVESPGLLAMWDVFQASRFNASPLLCEAPFSLALPGGTVRGRIDSVFPVAGGGIEVVDFKSGRKQSARSQSASLQLPLYALAAAERLDVPVTSVACTYFFLQTGLEHTTHLTAKDVDAVRQRVDTIMEAIAAQQFRPRLGCPCYACALRRQSKSVGSSGRR